MTRPANPRYGEVPARRFDSGGSGRLRDPRLAWVRTGGRAALMLINIWIVLGVLLVLLAVTRLWRYQQDTQRICADDPSASGFAGDAMRQLTTIAALVVALVLDRPTLACSDQQALETALTLARLHDGPAFIGRTVACGSSPTTARSRWWAGRRWGNVQVMVPGAGLFWIWR